MLRHLLIFAAAIMLITSCRSTRKIQTVIAPKDSTAIAAHHDTSHDDSLHFIQQAYAGIMAHHIPFTTFSAKIEVDYIDADGKKTNVTAHVRMLHDSVIWISVRGLLGIEGVRAYITPDSVKVLDKQNNKYLARSVAYLQDMTALPLDLPTLQDLLVGNPVFLDSSNIVSYSVNETTITLQSIDDFFKNLLTIDKSNKLIQSSKLDDVDESRNRTCFLTYTDYENKKGFDFPTKRQITVAEKKKLDIRLDYKQYDFNETLSFPFTVPKNYKLN